MEDSEDSEDRLVRILKRPTFEELSLLLMPFIVHQIHTEERERLPETAFTNYGWTSREYYTEGVRRYMGDSKDGEYILKAIDSESNVEAPPLFVFSQEIAQLEEKQ